MRSEFSIRIGMVSAATRAKSWFLTILFAGQEAAKNIPAPWLRKEHIVPLSPGKGRGEEQVKHENVLKNPPGPSSLPWVSSQTSTPSQASSSSSLPSQRRASLGASPSPAEEKETNCGAQQLPKEMRSCCAQPGLWESIVNAGKNPEREKSVLPQERAAKVSWSRAGHPKDSLLLLLAAPASLLWGKGSGGLPEQWGCHPDALRGWNTGWTESRALKGRFIEVPSEATPWQYPDGSEMEAKESLVTFFLKRLSPSLQLEQDCLASPP
ncbi:uncharacterized protein LOC128799214 [Vidua chalybeata]|uniref:uncharacterized protein LOC128799214 n=1 Tax=Vidua chalybeata TaxID=81927 RepID=UPI0023A89D6D|nr:uncharacterized protein LOC128799214 [Vidua chalybeata]